jgi:ParB family transcriptional regulator, chromosome partitioning protein
MDHTEAAHCHPPGDLVAAGNHTAGAVRAPTQSGGLAMSVRELDLHRLELRFDATRVAEPQAVQRIAVSLERCGQLVPCVVVNDPRTETGEERLVLIDGYRRVAALRLLGRDTVSIECWACDLTTALIILLTRRQDRAFAVIEQALVLRELLRGQGISQHELARRCGHDVSWVNRRLQLLQGLPDSVLATVCAGRLSSWAASRLLVPLARANIDHAERLLQALARQPLSTRELRRWFEHYQTASHATRERMVRHPGLLLQALQERDAVKSGEQLRDGPEGACADDLRRIEALIARLRRRLPCLVPLPEILINAVPRLQAALNAFCNAIKRSVENDITGDLFERACVESAGPQSARDRSAAAPGAQYGAAHSAPAAARGAGCTNGCATG